MSARSSHAIGSSSGKVARDLVPQPERRRGCARHADQPGRGPTPTALEQLHARARRRAPRARCWSSIARPALRGRRAARPGCGAALPSMRRSPWSSRLDAGPRRTPPAPRRVAAHRLQDESALHQRPCPPSVTPGRGRVDPRLERRGTAAAPEQDEGRATSGRGHPLARARGARAAPPVRILASAARRSGTSRARAPRRGAPTKGRELVWRRLPRAGRPRRRGRPPRAQPRGRVADEVVRERGLRGERRGRLPRSAASVIVPRGRDGHVDKSRGAPRRTTSPRQASCWRRTPRGVHPRGDPGGDDPGAVGGETDSRAGPVPGPRRRTALRRGHRDARAARSTTRSPSAPVTNPRTRRVPVTTSVSTSTSMLAPSLVNVSIRRVPARSRVATAGSSRHESATSVATACRGRAAPTRPSPLRHVRGRGSRSAARSRSRRLELVVAVIGAMSSPQIQCDVGLDGEPAQRGEAAGAGRADAARQACRARRRSRRTTGRRWRS